MLRFRLGMEFTPQAWDEAAGVLRSLAAPVRAEPGCSATRLLRGMDDRWTVPIGGGIGKIFKAGKKPMNDQVDLNYNIVTLDYLPSGNWLLRLQLLFPR